MPVELDATGSGNGDGQDEDSSSPKMGLRGVGLHRQRPRKAAVELEAVISNHHDDGMGLRS